MGGPLPPSSLCTLLLALLFPSLPFPSRSPHRSRLMARHTKAAAPLAAPFYCHSSTMALDCHSSNATPRDQGGEKVPRRQNRSLLQLLLSLLLLLVEWQESQIGPNRNLSNATNFLNFFLNRDRHRHRHRENHLHACLFFHSPLKLAPSTQLNPARQFAPLAEAAFI